MPTIKDIAQLAGVSHGTVSNVLNKRGNVSVDKILLVEEAARKLGYSPNQQAQQLRGSTGREHAVAVVLPGISLQKYARFFDTIQSIAQAMGYACHLWSTWDLPQQEEAALRTLASRRIEVVLLISCLSHRSDALHALEQSGAQVICVQRQTEYAKQFVGFDCAAIANLLYDSALRDGRKSLNVFTGLSAFSDDELFSRTIRDRAAKDGISCRTFQTDPTRAYPVAFKIASENPAEAVIISEEQLSAQLSEAYAFRQEEHLPHFYTVSSAQIPMDDLTVTRQRVDYSLLAKRAMQLVGSEESCHELLAPASTDIRRCVPHIQKKATLNVLILESPSTTALQRLLPDFEHTQGVEVRLAAFPYKELYEILKTPGTEKLYDVVRMDFVWLPWLAPHLLRPMDTRDAWCESVLSPMLAQMKPETDKDGNTIWAIPFDPSVQLLFYRKDLMEDTKLRRMFYESYRHEMEVPATFEAFNELMRFFSQRLNGASPVECGASFSQGSVSGIICEYLPRLFSLGGSLFSTAGHPQVNTDTAIAALENYLTARSLSESIAKNSWWNETVGEFALGRTAFLNVFTNHAYNVTDLRRSKIAGRIGFAPIPGRGALRGGGMLGITKDCSEENAAKAFISWVTGERLAVPFTLLGGTSPCASVYRNEELLRYVPWLSAIPEQYSASHRRKMPFVGNQALEEQEVERILGLAIANAINGVLPADTALQIAQQQLTAYAESFR